MSNVRRFNFWQKVVLGFVAVIFVLESVGVSFAQSVLMPVPGSSAYPGEVFAPPVLKGVKIYPDNPLRLDFILDKGNSSDSNDQLKVESIRLIKYFLASITVPENDLWVNLSPYEKDRIVPEAFGVTEMGRDLLAQDYLLKQITASVIYPEGDIGKKFWAKVYIEAQKRFGTTDIPVDTFNKVWIVPEKAVVYESKDSACVVESRLKVMLETDYLATATNTMPAFQPTNVKATQVSTLRPNDPNDISKDILREIVIPILEKEVNEGKNFAQLRQVYHSLILAIWYKDKIMESVLGKAYVDRNKTGGVDIEDKTAKEKIWAQYVEAFKKGAYDYIKTDVDLVTQQPVPRKYFSGGVGASGIRGVYRHQSVDFGQLSELGSPPYGADRKIVSVKLNAMVNSGTESIRLAPILASILALIPPGASMQAGIDALYKNKYYQSLFEWREYKRSFESLSRLLEQDEYMIDRVVVEKRDEIALGQITMESLEIRARAILADQELTSLFKAINDQEWSSMLNRSLQRSILLSNAALLALKNFLSRGGQEFLLDKETGGAIIILLESPLSREAMSALLGQFEPQYVTETLWSWITPEMRHNGLSPLKYRYAHILYNLPSVYARLRAKGLTYEESARRLAFWVYDFMAIYRDMADSDRSYDWIKPAYGRTLSLAFAWNAETVESNPVEVNERTVQYISDRLIALAPSEIQKRLTEVAADLPAPTEMVVPLEMPDGVRHEYYGKAMDTVREILEIDQRKKQPGGLQNWCQLHSMLLHDLLKRMRILSRVVGLGRSIREQHFAVQTEAEDAYLDAFPERGPLMIQGFAEQRRESGNRSMVILSSDREYSDYEYFARQALEQPWGSNVEGALAEFQSELKRIKEEYQSQLDEFLAGFYADLANRAEQSKDTAMGIADQKGGVDLTRDKLGLQVQSDWGHIQFNIDPAMIQQLQNLTGLTPVIIDIQPMAITVPVFLGFKGANLPDQMYSR
ncbi:MAG: hypothetical protein HQL20_08120 [Candidatus Omnitrophica bacterium]|nr:hypothetical protein [Candidatus Omnitrophota bacterium]